MDILFPYVTKYLTPLTSTRRGPRLTPAGFAATRFESHYYAKTKPAVYPDGGLLFYAH